MIGRYLRHPTGVAGLVLVAVLVLSALLSLVWTPYDPLAVHPLDGWLPPSPAHLLGTDSLGRDTLSILLAGARVTLLATVVAAIIATVVGVLMAALIAVVPGPVSAVLRRFVDMLVAFPTLVLAIVLVTGFGASTWIAGVAIGLSSSVVVARTVLPELELVLASDYVLLGIAAGAGTPGLLRRHVIPNVSPTVVVRVTQIMSVAALAEAGLSYLGFGTPAPTPSWGRTLAELQSQIILRPDVLIAPSLAIMAAALGFALCGDALRDALDPRARRRNA